MFSSSKRLSALAVVAGLGLLMGLSARSQADQACCFGSSSEQRAVKAELDQTAPGFKLKDIVTGESISLADYKDKVVVLVWQSIHCPWDKARPEGGYQRVLTPLAQELEARGVQFIGINSNHDESIEQVKSYLEGAKVPYPVLKDPENKLADQYGAQTTPHFFVISKGEQKLLYKGGFEQVPTSPARCGQMDEAYLLPVLEAVLDGKPLPYTQTQPKGCTVKRK